jgi:hypothetical protein
MPLPKKALSTSGVDEPIWFVTDASKVGIGAVLLQGPDWKTAR